VRTEYRLTSLGYECWEALYGQATSAGCGEIVPPDEERLAATDELLAAALPVLMRVGNRFVAAAISRRDPRLGNALAREAAATLRLLDRALIAHGRDHGYDPEAWRTRAATTAWVLGDSEEEFDATLLATIVEDVVRGVGRVFVALPRDRLGVPEWLSDAIGQLLVVYATAGQGRP